MQTGQQKKTQQSLYQYGAVFFILGLMGMSWLNPVCAEDNQEIKSEHFIVYYWNNSDRDLAKDTLRKAEEYYRNIGDKVGYSRTSQFWTWDERVKIILFPDQKTFLAQTGFPAWSTGFSDRDSQVFKTRAIITYRQEKDFLDGLLPHEISHLILHDFIPAQNLPIWFDEGIAQLQEKGKSRYSRAVVDAAFRQKQLFPFSILMQWDIRRERNPRNVQIFYAQSQSVVEFLLNKYGAEAFRRLCRDLRDSRSLSEALPHAYSNQIASVGDLEAKWLNDIRISKGRIER